MTVSKDFGGKKMTKLNNTKHFLSAIGTFLFEERIGCFSNPTPAKAQAFLDHLQEYFRHLQPLMYNVPIYKLYKTKLWKKFEYHSDKVFELGRYFIDKVNLLVIRLTKHDYELV